MAIGQMKQDLLKDFWEQHSELISQIAEATSQNPNSTDEQKEIAKDLKKILVKYNFNGKEKLGNNKLALEIITRYVEDNKNITEKELVEKFKGAILPLEEAKEKDSQTKYKCWDTKNHISMSNGSIIAVNSRKWTKDEINKLIEKSNYKSEIEEIY